MPITHKPKSGARLTGTEYEASDAHVVELTDADIPSTIARDSEVAAAVSAHAGVDAYQDLSAAADGPLTVDDLGGAWGVAYNHASAVPVVASGALTNANDGAAASRSSYAERTLPGDVTRIGARFSFGPGAGLTGAVALVAWTTSIAAGYPAIPTAALHLVVSPHKCDIQTYDGGTTTLRSIAFASSLAQDGTVFAVEAVIDPERGVITVTLPDGSVVVTDPEPDVVAFAGPHACWEVYQQDASADPLGAFVEVWADSRTRGSRSSATDMDRIAPAIAAASLTARATALSYAPTATNTSATTSDADLDATNLVIGPVIAPLSGRMLVTLDGIAACTVAGNLLWGVAHSSNGSTFSYASATSVTKMVSSLRQQTRHVFTGLTPGASYWFKWYHKLVSGTTASTAYGGSNGPAVMTVEPLA